jgi:hypothetical protein
MNSRSFLILVIAAFLCLGFLPDVKAAEAAGDTALHAAVREGSVKKVKALLVRGTDINAANSKGVTPLMDAVASGSMNITRLLVRNGALIDVKDDTGDTLLHKAVRNNDYKISGFLLKNGANPDEDNFREGTPLYIAVGNSNEKMVRLLVKYGADVNTVNEVGATPLQNARLYSSAEIVRLLVRSGALEESVSENIHQKCGPYRLGPEKAREVTVIEFDRAGAGANRRESEKPYLYEAGWKIVDSNGNTLHEMYYKSPEISAFHPSKSTPKFFEGVELTEEPGGTGCLKVKYRIDPSDENSGINTKCFMYDNDGSLIQK